MMALDGRANQVGTIEVNVMNRNLLTAVKVIDHTPIDRLGDPEDLPGYVLWLPYLAASFVTGIPVPEDGGTSAYPRL